MKHLFKIVIAYVFLAAFLVPQVNNVFHGFEHINDFHCLEKVDKHFHAEEHSCDICDYTFYSAQEAKFFNVCIQVPVTGFNHFIIPHQQLADDYYSFSSSRAPPAVS